MKNIFLASALLFLATACSQTPTKNVKVLISTNKGDMVIRLYDETPLHRDNFVKLVKDGFYNDLLFHRVIKDFMIQGGDPASKNAPIEMHLGEGGPGYTVDAELKSPMFFHKKGAIAAARQPDRVNPEKKSSGSQFYIVQGKPFTSEQLSEIVLSKSDRLRESIFNKIITEKRDTLNAVAYSSDQTKINEMQKYIMGLVDAEFIKVNPYKFTPEQQDVYTKTGGTPFLDGDYTVFGEVITGLSVVDSIAAVATNPSDRPLEDIKIIKMKFIK